MPQNQIPDIFALLIALLVSLVSGTISITRRILRGTPVNLLWLASEYMAAILCGWIAFDAYDSVSPFMPDWVTVFMFVAVASHTGGKVLQISEQVVQSKMDKTFKDRGRK